MKNSIIILMRLIIVVLICFSVFTACDENAAEMPNTTDLSSLPTETAAVTGEISVEDIEYFHGVVLSLAGESSVVLEVEEKYQPYFGETVKVKSKDVKNLNVAAGDTIRVVVDTIFDNLSGQYFTVEANCIQVVKFAQDKAGYSTDKFSLPSVNELLIEIDFNDVLNSPYRREVAWKKIEASARGYSDTAVRVVAISDNRVYFTETFGKVSSFVIDGIPEYSFSVGDCVDLEYYKFYEATYVVDYKYKRNTYYVISLDDIIIFRKSSNQTIEDQYYEPENTYPYDKPVIYLYPETETDCSVRVNLKGELTCTYPDHGKYGWQNFKAMPDGTLIFPDGSEYYCLYWEGEAHMEPDLTKGFCVKGSDTAEFLADILPKTGLTSREANEFIIYWLPILQKNEYNLISFQSEAYTSIAELEINPMPDSLLRVYMVALALDEPIEIEPQIFDGFERKGFTVVEWGGSIIND